MGLFSKKVKTQEQAVTTPNLPASVQPAVDSYFGKVGGFLADPSSAMPGINSLQQGAFDKAGLLSGSPSEWNVAMNGTLGAAGDLQQAPPASLTTAGMPGQYTPASVADLGARGYTTGQAGTLGPANLATAATLGPAAKAGYQGYDPSQATSRGYDASLVGDVGKYLDGSIERAGPESLLTNLHGYMNPYLHDVVDTTAADYDAYAGQQRAAMQADAARTGAFGGSRYGVAQGQMEGDLARGRASTLAGLRSDAFNTGAGLSNLDAARRQEAALANAGWQNERDLARGQLGFDAASFNAGARNDASRFGADASNVAGLENMRARNDASRFGADAFNTSELHNVDAANQFARDRAGFAQEAGLFNAGAANDFSLADYDARNKFALENMGAANDAAAQTYQEQQAAARQNAGASNDAMGRFYDTAADLGKFNAGEANQNSQFNTNLAMDKARGTIDALANYGNMTNMRDTGERNDLTTQADLGDRLYQLQLAQSPYGQMLAAQGLLDPSLIGAVSGQTITSSGTTKKSGGLLGSLLSAGAQLGSAALLSDRRLKTNVVKLGELEDGLGVYEYDYIWGEHAVGCMADEVAQLRPWALGPEVNGFATVDYGEL